MITQQLIDFIKDQLGQGKTGESIKQTLLLQGWKEEDIDQGFFTVKNPQVNIPSPPQYTPKESSRDLIGIGDLLSTTLGIYKKNFWRFWLVTLIYIIIAGILVTGTAFGAMALAKTNLALGIVSFIILGLLLIFILSGLQVSTILVSARNDDPLSMKEILKQGLKKMFSFWWLNMLISGISLACMLPGIGLTMLTILGIEGWLTIGGIVMIILAVFISIYLSQVAIIYILEKESILNSILKSRDYVKNNWWKVFVRILLFGIIVFVAVWLLTLLLSTFLSKNTMDIVTSIINILIVAPLFLGYNYSLYKSLKAQKANALVNKKGKGLFIGLAAIGLVIILALIIYPSIYSQEILDSLSSNSSLDNLSPQQLNWLNQAFDGLSDGNLEGMSEEEFNALIKDADLNIDQELIDQAHLYSKDARIQVDLAQMRDVALSIYKEAIPNTYLSICSGNKLNNLLEEIAEIQSSIIANNGNDLCFVSDSAYCIYSTLNNGKYFCIDSTGSATSYDSMPDCNDGTTPDYTCNTD